MEIIRKVHCFFEQSGTFKRAFAEFGIPAEDYDIQNNFRETDHQIDLFAEIENGYDGKPSIFDGIGEGDLIMAFFPCIYFNATSQILLSFTERNYRNMTWKKKTDYILDRVEKRERFYRLAVKMLSTAGQRNQRIIMENPWSEQTYLKANFPMKPTIIDTNRMARGDYFVKPTAYFFLNCEPSFGQSFQNDKERKRINELPKSKIPGLCSEERSAISPDYARNFIADFILGSPAPGGIPRQADLFD